MLEVLLPELGEDIQKATIACWHVQDGDVVEKDQDIVELVTDKATFFVSAESAGIVKNINFKEGDEAKIGSILAEIHSEG